jgi:hypothetical protein
MTPQAFIAKWRDNPLSERAGGAAALVLKAPKKSAHSIYPASWRGNG